MKSLTKTQSKNIYYEIRENSNYEIKTKDTTEIVEFEQFLLIIKKMANPEYPYITLNDKIISIHSILYIKPTNKKTSKQEKNEISIKITKDNNTDKKLYTKRVMLKEYFDNKYGINKWGFLICNATKGKLILSRTDYDEFEEYYKK